MKNYFKIIIAFALVLCVIASTGAMFGVFADPLEGITVANGSQNLLANGGFEYSDSVAAIDSVTENTYLTNGWVVGNAANTSFAISEDAKSGKKSLSATLSAGAEFTLRSENADGKGIISGLESGVYSLSLYAKGSGNIEIRYKDAAVKNITSKPLTLTSDWQILSVDTIVVAASGKIQFEICSAGDNGTVLIDDVSFTKYTGLQNGDFESAMGYTVPQALYDFGSNTNYSYIDNGNVLINADFEESTAVTNTSGKSWKDATIVKGWTSSYTHKNFVYSITDDTHSGKYSLRIDMGPAAGNNDDTRLHPDKELITDTEPKGKITGLDANTTYIVSYWVKGTAKTRIYAKKLTDLGAQDGDIKDAWITTTDDWELITEEVKSNALGQAWWNINVSRIENVDSYIIIDDISMLTKAQAIANTEAMIDSLNLKSAYAVQAKSDIENWATLLGKSNISNYSKYDEMVNGKTDSGSASTPEQDNTEDEYTYLSLNNLLENSGFENSNTVTNTSGKGWSKAIITEGWTTNYSASAKFNYSISNDSHSGNNSLKVSMPAGSDDTRIFANKNLITDTDLKGRMSGLAADQTYIVSYWVKGSGQTQVFWKTLTSAGASDSNMRDGLKQYDNWTLVTDEVASYAVGSDGQAWWNINVKRTDGTATEVYIDDVMMQTKAQAIANVEAMIDALDTDKSYSKQAISDIEQWVTALGSANISNYDLFVSKKSVNANNVHNNSGFEVSASVNYTSGRWKSFTDGWMTSDEIKAANTSIEIIDDAHNGKNALKLTGIKNKEYRIFNTKANSNNSTLAGITEGLTASTTYLVSYWVKGNATSRVYAKSYSSNTWNNDWGAKLDNPGNAWKLYTKEIKSNSAGEAWYNVYVYINAGTEIYLDDMVLQTKEQAIDNVEAMITAFDPSDEKATKKAADIEQWISALGKNNISNYQEYESKCSLISNPDFELSDELTLKGGAYKVFTIGWKTDWYSVSDAKYSAQIVKDAYSGNNALKVSVEKADGNGGLRIAWSTAIDGTTPNGIASGYTPNTDYLLSYWVKGTADTAVRSKTHGTSGWYDNVQSPAHTSVVDTWTLNGHTIKSNDNGEAWWNIYIAGKTEDTYAIIDKVECIPVSEAKSNVEAMIDAFDYTIATDNDVYVINQWMSVVTVSDSAKNSFDDKLADYEALKAERAWKAIDGVYGWETSVEGKIVPDSLSVAYGNQSLKINAQEAVSLRPVQVPFGMQNGYYTLVLYAKGGGKVNITALADNGINEYELLNETINITSGWDRFVISNIDIKENYSISSLRFTFSDSSEIYLDAVQMYRQIGPGSRLDDITDNVLDDVLILDGAPDGYYTEIYKTSNTDVLSKSGQITVPKFNSDIEFRFKITNINDDTDYAISDIRVVSVNGTDGAAPVDKGEEKTLRTITDDTTKVSVTAKMTDDARLTVKVLDENSSYYDLLLNYEYECIAHYNIFTIPQSAYEGDRTFTFTVGEEYNGKTVTVSRYDKDTRALEEYEVKVTDGKVTVTTPNDGAFMIQKPIEKKPASQGTTVDKSEDKKDDTSDKQDSDKKEENKKDEFNKPNKQVIVKQKGNSKLIWTIIIIGLGLLLLMLIFTIIVIILRKRRAEEEETLEPSPNETEQM